LQLRNVRRHAATVKTERMHIPVDIIVRKDDSLTEIIMDRKERKQIIEDIIVEKYQYFLFI